MPYGLPRPMSSSGDTSKVTPSMMHRRPIHKVLKRGREIFVGQKLMSGDCDAMDWLWWEGNKGEVQMRDKDRRFPGLRSPKCCRNEGCGCT